jgi:hypothetical protein
MNTAPSDEGRRSDKSARASVEVRTPLPGGAAEPQAEEYESAKGCLMMVGATILCAIAIVLAFVVFGDFQRT